MHSDPVDDDIETMPTQSGRPKPKPLRKNKGKSTHLDKDSDDDEPLEVPTPTSVKRKRLTRGSRNAEEDEEVALQPGDSMYSSPTGVKGSTMPKGMKTRGKPGPLRPTHHSTIGSDTDPDVKATVSKKKKVLPTESSPTATALDLPATSPQDVSLHETTFNDNASGAIDVDVPHGPTTVAPLSQAALKALELLMQGQPLAVERAPVAAVAESTQPSSLDERLESATVTRSTNSPSSVDLRMQRMENMFAQQSEQMSMLMSFMSKGFPSAPAASVSQTAIPNDSDSVSHSAISLSQSEGVHRETENKSKTDLGSAFELRVTPTKNKGKGRELDEGVTDAPIRVAGDESNTTDEPFTPRKPSAATDTLSPAKNEEQFHSDSESNDANVLKYFSAKKEKISPRKDKVKKEEVTDSPSGSKKSRKFGSTTLDDLETVYIKHDITQPCGVSRPELQDSLLAHVYKKAPNLPGGATFTASWDPQSKDRPGSVGGRLMFRKWGDLMEDASPTTILHAVTMVECGQHVNPSLADPNTMSLRVMDGTPSYQIIYHSDKVAVFVSAGSSKEPRYSKTVCVMLHNQHHERLVAFTSLCLGHKDLRAGMRGKALIFQTKLSAFGQGNKSQRKADKMASALTSKVFGATSPTSDTHFTPGVSYPATYKLDWEDKIPAYDARNRAFNFSTDMDKLTTLPKWDGEIPVGAFTVVGYSMSSFKGTAYGSNGAKVWQMSANLLWVVVCGTTAENGSDSSDDD
ncbi:hypothetical protein C8F04DRAFT_1174206 [Mycena alexandri]|uniref:Uncharacterized protein n=1 Tax=Mycena alexandri TaxID=1745969 RepID=A0AAD6TGH4_9AGAR|nr:hypothetical protein C8F04DRAFT_1174206 [Mycena alexandri]